MCFDKYKVGHINLVKTKPPISPISFPTSALVENT